MTKRASLPARVTASALLAAGVLTVGSAAHAQNAGFAVDQFDPSERGSDWFANESLDLRGNLRPAIGVVADWSYRPLVVNDASGNVTTAIVQNQFVVHPGASLVLWDRLRLGIDLPVQAFADGNAGVAGGVTYTAPSSATSVGDLRVGFDVRLFGTYGDAVTGALGTEVYVPTGSASSYAGDGSVRIAPRVTVAGDIGMLAYAVKVGTQVRELNETIDGAQVGTNIFFSVADGLRVLDKKLVIGPEIFGSSVVTNGAFFSTRATPLEVLFGAHYTVGNDWRLGAGISKGLSLGYGSPVLRGLLSVEWAPGMPPPDRDHDHILDADDACPDVPGIKTDDPKTNGCPPPSDRDHDGILDDKDACPDVPGVKTDDSQTNGCGDRDHDGVFDMDDACPDVPGVETSDPKTNGCPAPEDRDHDGILDKDDTCPDVPGLKTGDPKTHGCPPDPDRDKDGIPNERDACPDEAGKPNPDPKKNGCPEAFVKAGQIVILDQIRFRTGSALIEGKESDDVLQAVLAVLTQHPEIKGVRVEGHTDNRGNSALNKKLSADRAAAVVDWLVKHGVDESKLSSAGFGQERPIDENKTETGRKNNRRVEFHIEN